MNAYRARCTSTSKRNPRPTPTVERWRCACPRPCPPCTPTRTPPYGEAGLNSVLPVTKVSERNQSQSSHEVIKLSRKVPQQSRQVTKVIFLCRTTVSHTLGKHSTRPHDTTRSNLTGPRSRHAARSGGAAQKCALHRDQWLVAATARIDPAATGRRRSARSTGAGDERGDSRPLDRADQATTACDDVLTAGMPLERAECRPASAASHFLPPD